MLPKRVWREVVHAPRVQPTSRGHSNMSGFVRRWPDALACKREANPVLESRLGHRFETKYEEVPEVSYRYEYPPGFGYCVAVSMRPCRNVPGMVLIGCTNWRAEHEPDGVIEVAVARRFAKVLLDFGARLVENHYETLPGMHDSLRDIQTQVHWATDDAVKGYPSWSQEKLLPPLPFTPLWGYAAQQANEEYDVSTGLRDWCGLVA